ncbi:class I histocompatibility antigen, F10 alpha chain-like [Dryobates pubescens]|uniref:class I histocompatibility antigen, F10 alpha chain-like n=1 Tax=Dryobates pubescens TaxID=118200 RepID=UPI0023B923F7|nr:class I histocompatibility antigen, F10 alpha chain-like [Dryobates pubescens]
MGSGWVLGLGLLLGVLRGAVNGGHSLRYCQVSVLEASPELPQFLSVGYVDGVPISRYDSETRRAEPLAGWMKANLNQDYWDGQSQARQSSQEVNLLNLDRLRKRYNHSGTAHSWQTTYGCELLVDGSSRGSWRSAYDGRDFLALEQDSPGFVARQPNPDQVVLATKEEWEREGTMAEEWRHYLGEVCVEWLKRYLLFGQEELERRVPPTVVVTKKKTQRALTLSCHLYGFYPRPIGVSWLKGAEVRDQDTQRGSIVPNSDGSFSTWASIEVLPQEQELYRCRVEHSSLPQPRLYPWGPPPLSTMLATVAAVVVAFVAVVGIGVAVWKRQPGAGQQEKGYVPLVDVAGQIPLAEKTKAAECGAGGSRDRAQPRPPPRTPPPAGTIVPGQSKESGEREGGKSGAAAGAAGIVEAPLRVGPSCGGRTGSGLAEE